MHLPVSKSHHKNWLESVQSRKKPLAPADVAHRSNTACIVSWIAMKLGRPLEWDPKAEKFKNDAEANAMLSRERARALRRAPSREGLNRGPQWSDSSGAYFRAHDAAAPFRSRFCSTRFAAVQIAMRLT